MPMPRAAPRLTLRKMHAGALLALLALGSPLVSGCGMLDAKLEARTVCFTLPDYPIPAAIVPGALSTDITYDLGSDLPILSQDGVRYSLVMQRARLTVGARSPAVNLGDIDQLTISVVAPPGSGLPEPELVRYQRGADPHPTAIEATASSDADLAPYVSGGQVRFLASASGALPEHEWSADVTACFLLTADVSYGKKL